MFKRKTAYEVMPSLVGSEMWMRDRTTANMRAGGLREVDQQSAADAFGFPATPLETTLVETMSWLHSAGHLTDDQVGRLAH